MDDGRPPQVREVLAQPTAAPPERTNRAGHRREVDDTARFEGQHDVTGTADHLLLKVQTEGRLGEAGPVVDRPGSVVDRQIARAFPDQPAGEIRPVDVQLGGAYIYEKGGWYRLSVARPRTCSWTMRHYV